MIPYGRHNIDEDDISAVVSAMHGDFLTTGPLVEAFEDSISRLVGAPAISVSSGTAALHCAYAAIDLKPGDEVITPPITFIATQATAASLGAKIVFADIQSDTGNMDPNAVEAALSSRTKAIVAVDYAGHPAELHELKNIAERNGIYLIEDAAHSIGGSYKKMPVGSIADITTFSFFPTKNLTTAEGGAISSNNRELLDRAKRFSRQGLVRDKSQFKIVDQGNWHQEVHEFGLNYRLPDILCALGLSQLKRINKFKEIRTSIFEKYYEYLGNIPDLILPTKRSYVDPMWHLFPIHVSPQKREAIFNKLRASGIGVQVNYMPAYWHPVFVEKGFKKGMFPISDKFYETEISLPMWASEDLTKDSYLSKIQEIFGDSTCHS